ARRVEGGDQPAARPGPVCRRGGHRGDGHPRVDAGVRADRGLRPATRRVRAARQSRRRGASSLRRIAMRLAIVATTIARMMKPNEVHVLMTGTCDVKEAGSHSVSCSAWRKSFTPMNARIAAIP